MKLLEWVSGKRIFPLSINLLRRIKNMIKILFSFLLLFSFAKGQNEKEPAVVNKVDLQKYIGKWFEIAKIPNWFQKNCTKNTTAEYTIREDGKIAVVNTCVESDGNKKMAEGVAKVADKISNAKLEVSFVKILGLNLFWGDYWIIGLGDNYEYAIVGTPNRKYGWILSRTPKLSQDKLDQINEILRQKEYDPKKFEFTQQDVEIVN
jgi:apolipoprotein D and lipocalin family protein